MTALVLPPVDPLDPPWVERFSAVSRLLNACIGSGDGAVTLSAHAGDRAVLGGPGLARWIDRLPFNRAEPGHCETWRRWHVLHGLLPARDGDAGWLADWEAVAAARAPVGGER